MGYIGVNEKMASEEMDRFILDPGSRENVGRRADSHLFSASAGAPAGCKVG